MQKLILVLPVLILFSCGENKQEIDQTQEKSSENTVYQTPEQLAERHVEADLKIPGNEEYTMKLYSEHLNNDDSIDYIITVNRFDRAMEEAASSDMVAKLAEIGYTGKYNHFYFMDGATKKFSSVTTIASSPFTELDVSFEYITTGSHKDIMIDYHIIDSYFRNYYSIRNNTPDEMLRSELFLRLGKPKELAYAIEFIPGEGEARDVLVYEAELGPYTIEKPEDVYSAQPERVKTDKLELHWKYNPASGNYYLKQ